MKNRTLPVMLCLTFALTQSFAQTSANKPLITGTHIAPRGNTALPTPTPVATPVVTSTPMPTPLPTMSPPVAPPSVSTDSNIAALVLAANSSEVAVSRVALYRYYNHNAMIRSFAREMVSAHEQSNADLNTLLAKINIVAQSTAQSDSLVATSTATVANFITLTRSAFYKAYINNEVTVHQNLLNELNTHLIPNAMNADLKMFLQNLVPVVQAHLTEAQKIATYFNPGEL